MSKWQQWEEQQASGTDESTPSVSRCHQVLQEHLWSSQVYQDITNLTLTQHNAQVALDGWGEYDYDYESERFQMEREFTQMSQKPTTHYQPSVSAFKPQTGKL